VTASAIFTRTREVPAAAASVKPEACPLPDAEKGRLGLRLGTRRPVERAFWCRAEVLLDIAGVAGRRPFVAGHLVCAVFL